MQPLAATTAAVASDNLNEPLPGFKWFFRESWTLFSQIWWKALVIQAAVALFFVIVIALGLIAVLGLGTTRSLFFAAILPDKAPTATAQPDAVGTALGTMNQGLLMALPFTVLLMVSLYIFFQTGVIQASQMLLCKAKEDNLTLPSVLHVAFARSIPLILSTMLVGVLTIGGFAFFVIPGIIIAVAATFTAYEVVIYNVSPTKALANSARLIQGNMLLVVSFAFLANLVAAIGFSVIQLLVTMAIFLLSFIAAAMQSVPLLILSVIIEQSSNFIFGALLSTYTIGYVYLWHRELRQRVSVEDAPSPRWMYFVGIIGIGLQIVMISLIAYLAVTYLGDTETENLYQEPTEQSTYNNSDYTDYSESLDSDFSK